MKITKDETSRLNEIACEEFFHELYLRFQPKFKKEVADLLVAKPRQLLPGFSDMPVFVWCETDRIWFGVRAADCIVASIEHKYYGIDGARIKKNGNTIIRVGWLPDDLWGGSSIDFGARVSKKIQNDFDKQHKRALAKVDAREHKRAMKKAIAESDEAQGVASKK